MLKEIIFALWFFAPAGVANVSPILVANLPHLRDWNAPMDLGTTFRGKRLLGDHKTWRGFIVGILMATITLWLQQYLVRHFGWAQTLTSQVDYRTIPTAILGPLFGIGALGGDALESFFKRQLNRPPGHGWFPFDQTDYIVGGAVASAPFVQLRLEQYVILLFLWLLVHVVATYIGFVIGLKERPI
ncbi:MAG TPA: CDP-archaeol synthase [Candidatus Saccharimonadales bacterium]|nr:CDP-archaeol synthase [Candidatus Saccharimonadales bacterium]